MTIAEIVKKMIVFYQGSHHDINHFLKVHSYARLIAQLEGVDEKTQRITEIAAVLHDIACPLCREKYGASYGPKQELEGMPLTREFFAGTDIEEDVLERVVYLVGHHHTLTGIEGLDYQILIEADYLVNANESSYSQENVRNMMDKVFRTKTGKELLQELYLR